MKINANGTEIAYYTDEESRSDYISLTDIARKKNPLELKVVVANWMRSCTTTGIHSLSFLLSLFEKS